MINKNTWYWRLWQLALHGNIVDPSAWIGYHVTIGRNNYIGPGCIIGANAEHRGRWGENKGAIICNNCVITGNVTIDGGLDEETIIFSNAFIMKGVHIGHDSIVWDNSTISPHVILGGHAEVGRDCNLGMGAIVHQQCKIGHGAMIGMNTTVTKKSVIVPYGKFIGSPAKNIGINWHKAEGLTNDEIVEIQDRWIIKS